MTTTSILPASSRSFAYGVNEITAVVVLKGQALWKPENQDKFLFLYMTPEEEVPGHGICWRKVTMYDTRSIRHFFLKTNL